MTYKIVVNPKYEALRPQVQQIVKGGRPAGAEDIYVGRNTLYRCVLNNTALVIKEFKKPNKVNAYVYTTLRKSKAARSFRNAMAMMSLGFLTPEPVAYGEVRSGLKLIESIYISRELTGGTEMREWEAFPFKDTLLPAFAREIYRLHQAGVFHKDFSPGNILFTDNAGEGYKFYYVDLNRMKFEVHDHRQQMRMFRAINLNPESLRVLARLYAEVSHQDKDKIEAEALAALDGYFADQRSKQRIKKWLKGLRGQ